MDWFKAPWEAPLGSYIYMSLKDETICWTSSDLAF